LCKVTKLQTIAVHVSPKLFHLKEKQNQKDNKLKYTAENV